MHFIDLGTGYQLTGFKDFESALSATELLCGSGFKVVYLNEACHMRDCEVRGFTKCQKKPDGFKYQNYHFTKWEQATPKAEESLKTAVEVFEKETKYKARYIVVVTPKNKKSGG